MVLSPLWGLVVGVDLLQADARSLILSLAKRAKIQKFIDFQHIEDFKNRMILVKNHHHTVINNNIYSLLEALLVTWLFKKFGIFKYALKSVLNISKYSD